MCHDFSMRSYRLEFLFSFQLEKLHFQLAHHRYRLATSIFDFIASFAAQIPSNLLRVVKHLQKKRKIGCLALQCVVAAHQMGIMNPVVSIYSTYLANLIRAFQQFVLMQRLIPKSLEDGCHWPSIWAHWDHCYWFTLPHSSWWGRAATLHSPLLPLLLIPGNHDVRFSYFLHLLISHWFHPYSWHLYF